MIHGMHRRCIAFHIAVNLAILSSVLAFTGVCISQILSGPVDELPNFACFQERPSDQFLMDIGDLSRGHPYLGRNAPRPHAGAHVHVDNDNNLWPKEGGRYPAIYAVADGIITRVDTRFPVGSNHRYGIDLTFAQNSSGARYQFCYSIEPMAPEPSDRFYEKFILVKKGQSVRKGDLIAYLYTPKGVNGCHVHFHLMLEGKRNFLAPTLFHKDVLEAFHSQCGAFRWINEGKALPICMGYRIDASENPFETGPQEKL